MPSLCSSSAAISLVILFFNPTKRSLCVTPWSQDLKSQDFQSCNSLITVYATTYQYYPTLIPCIKSALAFWKKKVLHILKAVADQVECLNTSLLGDHLQINAFLIPVLAEQEL